MKRLNTADCTGTNILYMKNGTFEFLQDSQKENVEQVLITLCNPNILYGNPILLWGCSASTGGGHTFINAGAIYVPSGFLGIPGNVGGEIFTVEPQTITVGAGVLVANLTKTQYTTFADPTDFSDGTPRNVHDIRQITFSYGTAGSGTGFFAAWNFSDLIPVASKIRPIPAWVPATAYQPGWANVSGNEVEYTKDDQGRVYLHGAVTSNNSSPSATIFTLPTGYTITGSSRNVAFACVALNATSGAFYTAYLATNSTGDVYFVDVTGLPTAASWVIELNTITFTTF